MKKNQEFLSLMQRYVVNISIAGSTLRNQGAKGVAEAARIFLAEQLDLSKLRTIQPSIYPDILSEWTYNLQQELPEGAKNWGTARKAINVFMVQVFLNKYLAEEYGMEKLKDVLETPLDSYAAGTLRRLAGRGRLPRWKGIIGLKKEDSDKYQEFASQVATENKLSRACLDIILWRPKNGEELK